MSWSRYDLGQANIFYDETHPLLTSFVPPPPLEEVKRCLTDFSCVLNGRNDSFHEISKEVEKDLNHGFNREPVGKAAEKIQHEVLSRVGGGYDEKVWHGIFEKCFFDQLTDSLSTSREDSRQVSRNKYYYDRVIRLPKVVDPKARQWSQAEDSRAMEPFTWSTLQALNKVGLEPSPFRIFDKSPLEANLRCYPWLIIEHKREKDQNETLERVVNCQAANAAACAISLVQQTAQYAFKLPRHAHIPPIPTITTVGSFVTAWLMYFAENFDAPCSRRDTDEVLTRRRKEGYVRIAITGLYTVEAYTDMIIDNAHTRATRVFKPLIASYIEQWKHIHSEQQTGSVADLLATAESRALREKDIEQRRLVVPIVRDLLDAPAGMELDDMAHKKVTPLFLGMLMHHICTMQRELISKQVEKEITERLHVILANGSAVTTEVEAVHRVQAIAQLPVRGHREETAQTASSTQDSELAEVDNDDPDDSDYNPTNYESRSRSPAGTHQDDGDAHSEVAVSVASTSAFSFRSFSNDTTVLWKTPETPKAGSSSKKGSEKSNILGRQSSQLSEGSDDETPKPSKAGQKLDFNFTSPIPGSSLGRLEGNPLDGPPVFAGRSPPSQPKWPPGRMFAPPETQKSPRSLIQRSDTSAFPPADANSKQCIDLTSDRG
ncbi:uncharacterized protein FTJAE_4787 [Fusarium tjaetaba]|uniref:Uncharacterized protein n=1 Tax=Fusarium tjaetaba TaxID=1567544 RepID=A0A8H5RUP6_9HYPO|nr:uncharacterized protein FTJAE_4787 [Fusarium tjaetaba]KAF5639449.1 hypothetical protein FTJAE_4787 [Fusarium tjaetaba]